MNLLGLDFQTLMISIPAILICITVHEFSHGYVAYKLGDQTAKLSGRLSLNPIHHIDPMGFLCLLLFHFGWAKPVPVDPRNFRKQRSGMALVGLAGPLSNLILSFFFMLLATLIVLMSSAWSAGEIFMNAMAQFLYTTAIISVGLAVFNLLPIPPLDGSKILYPILPRKWVPLVLRYERYVQIVLIILLFLGILSGPLSAAITFVLQLLIRGVMGVFSLFRTDVSFLSILFGV